MRPGSGFLKVLGLGPGSAELLAPLAREALERASVLVGYGRYLELVPGELRRGKELFAAGMKREVERAEAAIDAALAGKNTALVSGGDPGVYGMASLVLEVLEERGLLDAIELEVVPGVPALTAAAAILGAPIGHDFACISLSDLLTPRPVIEKRLEYAAMADFVICLYNPRSRSRPDLLAEAMGILSRHRPPETVIGAVRQAYREGQQARVSTLAEYDPNTADMLTIVYVGNSNSRNAGGRMLTPRGYAGKYDLGG